MTVSAEETKVVRSGAWTLQIQVDGLPSDGASVDGIGTQLFVGGAYDQDTPSFDLSTDWPVLASSLADTQTIAGGAIVAFEDGYVSGGTFVSGTPSAQPMMLPLVLNGVSLELVIHHAVMTATRSDPTHLMTGTLAGVIDTAEFVEGLRRVAGRISTSLCGTAFEGIADQIAQAQDILMDETNAPSLRCAAISLGLGFTARQIANPTKVIPDPLPPPDPCAPLTDGGADASDASGD